MATDIGDAFVLLTQGATVPQGSALLTRDVMELPNGAVRVAIDASGGRHVLVPVGADPIVEDRRSRAVSLTVRELQIDGDAERFADLACNDAGLGLVFERVVADVLRRLKSGTTSRIVCSAALADWRALLQTAKDGVSRETVIGLLGELEVLSHLGHLEPTDAIGMWTGPDGHIHDFASPPAQPWR